MSETLKEFREFYEEYLKADIKGLRLIFAEHEINIKYNKKGSLKLVKIFEDTKFYLVGISNNILILSINE